MPEVLAELSKANVTLWMCTGDKEETAINIGRSCNLLENDTKLFYLTKNANIDSESSFNEKLKEVHYELIGGYNKGGGGWAAMGSGHERVQVALVLDGPTFKFYDENDKVTCRFVLSMYFFYDRNDQNDKFISMPCLLLFFFFVSHRHVLTCTFRNKGRDC